MKVAIAVVVAVLLLVASNVITFSFSQAALHNSQHALCPIIRVITKRKEAYPANPAKNPSRVQFYDLYQDFLAAGEQYRCGSLSKRYLKTAGKASLASEPMIELGHKENGEQGSGKCSRPSHTARRPPTPKLSVPRTIATWLLRTKQRLPL